MEIDLLVDLPKINRDVSARAQGKTDEQRAIARKYDWRYFDMRIPRICYGGYSYDGRWIPVVRRFAEYYKLPQGASILDVGCAKGYMLYDFIGMDCNFDVVGVDISSYAVGCCPPSVNAIIGNARDLSMFGYKEFDLVISINTIHNLVESECRQAVREIQRVGKNSFITVDAYRDDAEKERMMLWNTTGETIRSVKGWMKLFEEEKYTGDYYWFIP